MPRALGYNCTAVADIKGEQDDSGNYTGCIGQLQQGLADFAQIFTTLPLHGEPGRHSVVLGDDELTFTTTYQRPRRPLGDSDLLTSFLQFDLLSSVSLVASLALFAFLLKIQQHKDAIFSVVHYLFQHLELKGRTLSLRFLGLVMVAAFFIVTAFYSNFIMTDIVRQVHPKVLRYFNDIFNAEADLYAVEDVGVHATYKKSSNKILRSLAEKMEAQTLNKTLVKGGTSRFEVFTRPPGDRLFGYLGNVRTRKHDKVLVCSVMKKNNSDWLHDTSLWVPEDSELKTLSTAVYNRKLAKEVRDTLDLALLHYFEHGLYGDIFMSGIINALTSLFNPDQQGPDHLCYSDVLFVADPIQTDGVALKNIYFTMLATSFLYLIALAVNITQPAVQLVCTLPSRVHPKVLRYFNDIFNAEADLYMVDDINVHATFKKSSNKILRSLAEKMEAQTLNKTLVKGGTSRFEVFTRPPGDRLFGYLGTARTRKQDRVLVCSVMKKNNSDWLHDTSLWVPEDSELKMLSTAVYNWKLEKEVRDTLDLALLHYFEHGLYGDIFMSGIINALTSLINCDQQRPDHLCYSDVLLVAGPIQTEGVALKNIYFTILAMSLLYLVSLAVHITQPAMQLICAPSSGVNPKVLRYFNDIFNAEADLYVVEDVGVHATFKKSSNKILRSLAEKMEAQTLNKTLVKGGTSRYEVFTRPPGDRLFGYLGTARLRKHGKVLVCSVMKKNNSDWLHDTSLWVPEDSELKMLSTAVYNWKLEKEVRDTLDLALLHYFEHGLYEDIFMIGIINGLTSLINNDQQRPDHLCYSDVLLVADPIQTDGVALNNIYFTILATSILYLIALGIHITQSATQVICASSSRGERSDDGNYTGVIGQLQHDLADFAVSTQPFPLAGEPVDHSVVTLEDRLAFTTSYLRPSRPLGDSDILTSLLQFDCLSVVCIICLISLIVVILKLKQQKNAVFSVVQYVLQYTGIQRQPIGLRFLGLIIIAGFFLVNTFYSNFIMAGILSEVHPNVLRYFSDIFKTDADLFISEDFPRYRAFKTSSKMQLRFLAEKIETQTLNKTLVKGGSSSYDIFYGHKKRLSALLGTVGSLKNSRCLICTLMHMRSGNAITHSLWVPEDSEVLQMTTAAYNRRLGKEIKDYLNLALLHYTEQGLYGNTYYERLMNTLLILLQGFEKPDPLCYSDVIIVAEPVETSGVSMKNIYIFALFVLAIYGAALVIQLKELGSQRRNARKHLRRRRCFHRTTY
ncbi:hypothetical protein HDE_11694 [Halotydeus destructor]|nr:hypothetical protein HDE_11694 [Halotydeus destructor]